MPIEQRLLRLYSRIGLKGVQTLNKRMQGLAMDPLDTVTLDVPLFIRMMELAREDLKTDAELHEVVTRLLAASKEKDVLTMVDYNNIAGKDITAKVLARLEETAAQVPSASVLTFLESLGIPSDVTESLITGVPKKMYTFESQDGRDTLLLSTARSLTKDGAERVIRSIAKKLGKADKKVDRGNVQFVWKVRGRGLLEVHLFSNPRVTEQYYLLFALKNSSREETADGPIVLKSWQMKIYRELKQLSLRLRVEKSTTADKLIMITDQVTAVPLNLLTLMKQEDIVLHVKAESSTVLVLTYHKLARF